MGTTLARDKVYKYTSIISYCSTVSSLVIINSKRYIKVHKTMQPAEWVLKGGRTHTSAAMLAGLVIKQA